MKTTVVTIQQAKTNLSRLIQAALTSEDIIIVRGSKPVARLVPFGESHGYRRSGSMKNTLVVGPEFFEPLPEDELFGCQSNELLFDNFGIRRIW